MGYSTNLMGYSIRIQELFEKGESKPTKIKVYAESEQNIYTFGYWFTKTYRIKEPFLNCINDIMPIIKKDILDMEKTLDKS
jgi:hypothetical protein